MAEKTTDKPSIAEALAAVMEEVRGVGKGDFHNSPTAKFHFRGIDAVVNAVGPALRKHRVVVVPQLVSIDHRDVQTSGGKPARETCVIVKYVWTGPDGSTLEATVPGEAMDNGDKGTAKAMSVAFRIALLQALCLPTDDTDPDAQSYERAAPVQRQERRPEPPQQRQETGTDAARRRLRDTCTENGWDMNVVATKYLEAKGVELAAATEVASITKFREYLFTLPQADLQPAAAAAVNGAPA